MYWIIPLLLAFLCTLINPYIGLVGILYIGEIVVYWFFDENAEKALGEALGLGSIVGNPRFTEDIEIDAVQLAVLIDRAKAYCAGRVQDSDFAADVCVKAVSYMELVNGRRIVQEISAGLVDFLMDCFSEMHFSENQ